MPAHRRVRPSRFIIMMITAAAAALLVAPAAARADDRPQLSVYGFLRLDFINNSAPMSDLEAPAYVLPQPDGGAPAGETTMHARLSRLGIEASDWEVFGDGEGEGELEVDFAGGDGATPVLRLRHAYVAFHWSRYFEALAGQTWDLASPLFPSAQNDTQLLFAGNTGDRRAQLRVSTFPSDQWRIALAAGAPAAIDHQDADADGRLDGIAAELPIFQMLGEYRRRMNGDTMRVGIWGHWGQEQLADGTDRLGRVFGAHLFVPVARKLIVLGEVFVGKNADDLGGGIGQGLNPTTHRGIDAAGGWLELAAVPDRMYMVSLGSSIDTADEADLSSGDRTRNWTMYAVSRVRIDSLELAVELLGWRTEYLDADAAFALRTNLHLTATY